jgi:L-ectoine synthase
VIVTRLADLEGTDRDVRSENWRSRRLVLAKEGVGFSFHETTMYAGTETEMWYANHFEAVYCVGGTGQLENRETGEIHEISDGTMYLLDGNEKHTMRPTTDLRLICTFNPPVTGREVHDADGVYPLIKEERTEERKEEQVKEEAAL